MISRRTALRLTGAGLAGLGAGGLGLSSPAVAQFRDEPLKTIVARPDQVQLHWQNAGRNYETLADLYDDLSAQGLHIQALMNAGIYEVGPDGTYQPQGLHIEQGAALRPLNTRSARNANFYLKPNGVFYIDAQGAHIVRTQDYGPSNPLRLATQSGPLLFDAQGMHPRFLENSDSRKRRNAVGVREDGQVVFALADLPLNFWDFATKLREEEGCKAALYLDGAISNLWLASDGIAPNPWQPFAGMLSVTA